MRLLVVTQAVDADSSTLGFFVGWLKEFARRCEEVHVIGLSVGRHELPPNVRVMSMGKEMGAGKLARLFAFRKHLRAALPRVDGVFIHMCPEYLIAGWPMFGLARTPVMLWYAHRQTNWRVRMGERMADLVGTISDGSFPFASPKIRAMGHGIPTDRFVPGAAEKAPGRLVAVGRLSPIKRLELLVEALAILKRKGVPATLDLWGAAIMEGDRAYEASLRKLVAERGLEPDVAFRGATSYDKMPMIDAAASVALNACPDGALDKAVLEAVACGTPVVVTNRNFTGVFGGDAERCLASDDPEEIAAKIEAHLTRPDAGLAARLRDVVEREHSLARLVERILSSYERSRP